MGKLANIANILFDLMPLNAKLCVISWICHRKRMRFCTVAKADHTHSKEEILICSASDSICCQEELPAQRVGIPEQEGGRELDSNHEEHHIFRQWLVAHQFGDLEVIDG